MEKNGIICLVTGANRGIGLETVRQLALLGHTVILTSRNPETGLRQKEHLCTEGLDVRFVRMDVTDQRSIQEAKDHIESEFGRLDILVNNAAINYDEWNTPGKADMDEVWQTLESNLIGPWMVTQAFLPLLRMGRAARIVNVSSQSGSLHSMGGGTPAYSVSKAALNALTVKFAAELKPEGILVNAACPGWVRTDMGGPSAPRSVEAGAASIVWAATLPDDGPSGGFFRDGKPLPW